MSRARQGIDHTQTGIHQAAHHQAGATVSPAHHQLLTHHRSHSAHGTGHHHTTGLHHHTTTHGHHAHRAASHQQGASAKANGWAAWDAAHQGH
jgi:hypothetical protein